MCRLHGGEDAEFRETRNVLGRQHLSVLNAQTQVMRIGHFLFSLFVGVQHAAIRSVTDGMRTNLKASLERATSQTVDIGFRSGHHAFGLRSVAVRLEERCAPRAERAIGEKLEGANRELMMRIDFRTALEPLVHEVFVRAIEHGINAQGHAAFAHQFVKGLDYERRDFGFVDGCQAIADAFKRRKLYGVLRLRERHRRNMFGD